MIFSENRFPLFEIMRDSLIARGCRRHGFIGSMHPVGRRHRALDEAAAEYARLALAGIIKDAGLAGRNAVLAVHQFDLVAAVGGHEPAGLRRPRRTYLHEHLAPVVGERFFDTALPDPIDIAQHDTAGAQRDTRSALPVPDVRRDAE